MSPFTHLAAAECRRADERHPAAVNHDEAMSVLDEEVEEVKAEVYRRHRDPAALLGELVQVAAVARRWAGGLGLELVLGSRFAVAEAAAVDLHRKSHPPANSHHEAMTRLRRAVAGLWDTVRRCGPHLAGGQRDAAAALVAVAALCRRWAEDAGFCPAAGPVPPGPSPGDPPGEVVAGEAVVEEAASQPGCDTRPHATTPTECE